MDVSIIIVNYNTTKLVEACLQKIYQYTIDLDFDVWVVDNASSDRSIEQLQTQFPGIHQLFLQENIGFGRANNTAIQKARGEFVFLLNPDTELTSNAAKIFADFMRQPENEHIAVCGGHLFTANGQGTPSYGNFPSLLQSISSSGLCYLYKSYYRENLDTGVANTRMNTRGVDFVSGADMFIRKKVLDTLGAFDPDFFLYFEETELCHRIRKGGNDIVLLPSVKILHHEGASSASSGFNAFSFFHFERSKKIYYRKVFGRWYLWLSTPFDLLTVILKSLFGNNKGGLRQKLRLYFGHFTN